MPSKLKRPRSHRPFAQRPSTNSKQDQICQTDDDLLLNLQITNDLQKQGTSSNETSPNDFFKRQLILSSYIKKLSKENLELKNKLSITNSKLYSIKNKLTIHKTENEANRRHLMDNLAALSLDQNNAKKQLNDKINKFYINFHEEQQRTFNKLKIKEGKLTKLKSEKDETTFQLENVLNAFQVQTRLLEVARKEAFNAREENKETLQKLNDKLYLTSKQRCTNCEVKQKIQVKLTDDVADLTNKLNLKEQELIERKRINQILAEKLEGKKEELIKQELRAKKELEEANNLKIIYSKKNKEFELKLNKTEEERLKLLKNLENENNRTTSVIRQLIPEPCGLTPPEEINKSPLQNNDIIDDYNKSINNNNNLNKKQIQSSNNSYIISKKLNSEPPPEKIQKTSHHQIANEWRAVLDLADSLDFTQQNKNNNLQQPRISPLTTIPRMPAKTITKNKINKQQKQQLPPTNIKNQSNKNINQMNGIKNQFNSQSSSSNNLRITGIRVHERFPPPSKEQSNIQINQHIQYQAIRPPNIIQQNHQQQPIIPHLINQQNLTKINNFTVINNQLPWHGGTIIRQQTSKEPPPKLYRSFI